MKIIYRYLIKKFVGPLILTFLFSLFILLMQYIWLYIDELVGKGLEISVILNFLFYASAGFVARAAPLSILLSSLMAFGSMGEFYELVAFKSAGISILKLMLPLSVFATAIAIFVFWFSDEVSTKSFVKQKQILYNIKETKPALAIEEGVFYDGFDNYVIRIGKKHRDNETIEDVLFYDHSKYNGNSTMTYAKKGKMKVSSDNKYFIFYLYDGYFWDENTKKNITRDNVPPLTRAYFKEQYKKFDISSFQFQNVESQFYSTMVLSMNNSKIAKQIDSIKHDLLAISDANAYSFFSSLLFLNNFLTNEAIVNKDNSINILSEIDSLSYVKKEKLIEYVTNNTTHIANSVNFAFQDESFKNRELWSYEAEWWRKYTQAFACILFFFIGAPLGSIIRKGGIGIPLLITVLFFIIYFALSIIGEKIAKGSVIPLWFGMWLSTIILVPVCIFLSSKASKDSTIFSLEEYNKRIDAFIKKIKRIK